MGAWTKLPLSCPSILPVYALSPIIKLYFTENLEKMASTLKQKYKFKPGLKMDLGYIGKSWRDERTLKTVISKECMQGTQKVLLSMDYGATFWFCITNRSKWI